MVADNRICFASTGNPEFHSWEKAWDEMVLFDSPEYAAEFYGKALTPGLSPEKASEVTSATLGEESLWTRVKSFFITTFYNLFAVVYRALVNPQLNTEPRRHLITPAIDRPATSTQGSAPRRAQQTPTRPTAPFQALAPTAP
jgi:hypothetical protein